MGVASGPANRRVNAVGVLVPRLSVDVVGSTAEIPESAHIFTDTSQCYETCLGSTARAIAPAWGRNPPKVRTRDGRVVDVLFSSGNSGLS